MSACQQAITICIDVQHNVLHDVIPMILYLLFWSDDFEGAMLRKNKNKPVWIKTLTIFPLHDEIRSTTLIYSIVISCKKWS